MKELTLVEMNEVSGSGRVADAFKQTGESFGELVKAVRDVKFIYDADGGENALANSFANLGNKVGVAAEKFADFFQNVGDIFKIFKK